MDAALLSSTIGILVGELHSTIKVKKKLRDELKHVLEDINREMDMMNLAIGKHAESKDVVRAWVRELQELVYDIEDCIALYRNRVLCKPQAKWFDRTIHRTKTMGPRARFAGELQRLKKRALNAYERMGRYKRGDGEGDGDKPDPSTSTPEAELVGLDKPKQEVLELLKPAAHGEPKQLKVVSILGFGGLGKTTLADVVFQSLIQRFRHRAWVVASDDKHPDGILKEILSQVGWQQPAANDTIYDVKQLAESLHKYLREKPRYLIVIDGMQTQVWETIRSAFPDDGTDGRIIVTTSIQSIATTCCSHSGYVYRMQTLNESDSKDLLLKRVFRSQTDCPPNFDEGLKRILKKCDGIPLALVDISQHLISKSNPTGDHCEYVCNNLGSVLPSMNQVLIRSYENLPRHDLKICLLSVSIYPSDHQIERKSLVRRWLAEGFVGQDQTDVRRKNEDIAHDHFEKLIDRSIIQPVNISNNAGVKTCRLHDIMLDFIVRKSMSENFITFIHNEEFKPDKIIRRLCLHKPNNAIRNIDLSHVRSLTIFDHDGQDPMNFEKCKLLRVLHLEKCKEIKDSDIDSICKMFHLKYLSLRGTNVCKLPRGISKLQHLETMDIRETKVSILPIEILNLPQLTHLFGKFKLPRELNKVRLRRNLEAGKSKLETLLGFIMDGENQVFHHIMLHINKLRKVKIWAESAPNRDITDLLVSSLEKCFANANALKSLSIRFGYHSIDFLDCVGPACFLTSIKLEGKLSKLPTFITSPNQITELHLLSTGLESQDLSTLQDLQMLLYLKLVEVGIEFGEHSKFEIQSNKFLSLQRLYFQAQKLPQISIAERAMPRLSSLQLICKDVDGPRVNAIGNLKGLKEVTLASTVSEERRQAWEQEAKKHQNRPKINLM